jgi:predicted Fe-Mo cluster-binding NifX family protein
MAWQELERKVENHFQRTGRCVLRSGWPDLLIVEEFPGDKVRLIFVETKSGKSKTKKCQDRIHRALVAAGLEVVIAKQGSLI